MEVDGLALEGRGKGGLEKRQLYEAGEQFGPKAVGNLQFLSHFGNDIASGWKDCDIRLGHFCRDPIDGFLNVRGI